MDDEKQKVPAMAAELAENLIQFYGLLPPVPVALRYLLLTGNDLETPCDGM